MLLDYFFLFMAIHKVPYSSAGKRGRYEVDRLSDWPEKPKRNDDEECLLLTMI